MRMSVDLPESRPRAGAGSCDEPEAPSLEKLAEAPSLEKLGGCLRHLALKNWPA